MSRSLEPAPAETLRDLDTKAALDMPRSLRLAHVAGSTQALYLAQVSHGFGPVAATRDGTDTFCVSGRGKAGCD